VNVESMNGEISIPKVFKTYKDDFGGNEEAILRFVTKIINNYRFGNTMEEMNTMFPRSLEQLKRRQ
jgi:hypothetical protein